MSLEERVVRGLAERKLKLVCAESCTGGLFGARLTRVPGSGDVFLGGVISYQDEVKASLLKVDPKVLEEKGAVSREVARQMAQGVRALFGADLAVSITGFAGPNVPPGGEVGRVFLGLAREGGVEVHDLHFAGTRDAIREDVVTRALELVADALVAPRAR